MNKSRQPNGLESISNTSVELIKCPETKTVFVPTVSRKSAELSKVTKTLHAQIRSWLTVLESLTKHEVKGQRVK